MSIKYLAECLYRGHLKSRMADGLPDDLWPVQDQVWLALGVGFDHTQFKTNLEKERAAKRWASKAWANADESEKLRLTDWIVRQWGQIQRNSDRTYRRIVALVDSDQQVMPFGGVASYSKVLSFIEPNQFAIYDSRVSASLAILQLNHVPEGQRLLFKFAPGRGGHVNGFVDAFSRKSPLAHGFLRLHSADVYAAYNQLLKELQVLSGSCWSIEDFEKALFADAPELCESYVEAEAD